ncbi:hypothetical protein [Amycolatopsis australiensis]|uniref:Uncharacterized protein n=1 Tax=Amycolatopsis australiensis TaxID=546364 RepID=A0A1K1T675_9PSEU|nr:hypothetical protein [Amycolatopsis australiensis]SFW92129.1 hypothetical protein SAMN04489730_8407 [Amycolatopsis australiensis]
MTPLTLASIGVLPRLLQLVVGLLGLVFSIKGRARGVSGLMVGAFVVMLVTTAAGVVWQFVSLNAASWSASSHLTADEIQLIFLGVGLPLDAAAVLSWLLVALAVVRSGRRPSPGFASPAYPAPAQAGYPSPASGYSQPGPGGPAPQPRPGSGMPNS